MLLGQLRLSIRGVLRPDRALRQRQGHAGPRAGLLPGEPGRRPALPVAQLSAQQQEGREAVPQHCEAHTTRPRHAHQQGQRTVGGAGE